jgi:protein-tyrosine phosphatase
VIDIHSHLLPGVDDGSSSMEVSLPILHRFAADGVEVVVCTPHLAATEAHRVPHHRYSAIFEQLVAHAPPAPRLLRGWEIMLDAPGIDLTSRELSLGGSTAVLVEFPRLSVPPGAAQELHRLRQSGIVPVLAHPERYLGVRLDLVMEWRTAGAVMQIDATILTGNSSRSKLAREMLQQGLVDCIASDNHGDRRSLGAARQWLLEIGAEEQAQLLTHTNAEQLLNDQPIIPVSPVPHLSRGMFSRLRELLFRRA